MLIFCAINMLLHENMHVHVDATTSKVHVCIYAYTLVHRHPPLHTQTHSYTLHQLTSINSMLNLGAFTCNVNIVLLYTDTY